MRRYEDVVNIVRQRIEAGVLKPGQRIASVREMSALTGFSLTTVHRAYMQMEAEQIVVARPRSGYFVASIRNQAPDFSSLSNSAPRTFAGPVAVSTLNHQIMTASRHNLLECFGSVFPCKSLFPTDDMAFFMRRALRMMARQGPLPPDGDPALREFVAGRAILRGASTHASDVIITRGGLTPLMLALEAVTSSGGIVLIESPSYFPFFGLLRQRNLQAVEIYSHPQNGIDADQFEHLLKSNPVQACILMPNNHYPTGTTSSVETMRRIVGIAAAHRVKILECDDYGELGFHSTPARSLLSFDSDGGTVIQCGNTSSILGPDFGVGWVISRSHRNAIMEQSFLASLGSSDDSLQRAVVFYLSHKSFDRQILKMRQVMAQRMRHGLRLIEDAFPRGCAVSRPAGGFMCWIRVPREQDATALGMIAASAEIGIMPGPALSVTNSFRNFVALNLSFEWTSQSERKLRQLGQFAGA